MRLAEESRWPVPPRWRPLQSDRIVDSRGRTVVETVHLSAVLRAAFMRPGRIVTSAPFAFYAESNGDVFYAPLPSVPPLFRQRQRPTVLSHAPCASCDRSLDLYDGLCTECMADIYGVPTGWPVRRQIVFEGLSEDEETIRIRVFPRRPPEDRTCDGCGKNQQSTRWTDHNGKEKKLCGTCRIDLSTTAASRRQRETFQPDRVKDLEDSAENPPDQDWGGAADAWDRGEALEETGVALHQCPGADDEMAMTGRTLKPETTTCGKCNRSWCGRCDPAPAAQCHYCTGSGQSSAPIPPRQASVLRREALGESACDCNRAACTVHDGTSCGEAAGPEHVKMTRRGRALALCPGCFAQHPASPLRRAEGRTARPPVTRWGTEALFSPLAEAREDDPDVEGMKCSECDEPAVTTVPDGDDSPMCAVHAEDWETNSAPAQGEARGDFLPGPERPSHKIRTGGTYPGPKAHGHSWVRQDAVHGYPGGVWL